MPGHRPVLLSEVLSTLQLTRGQTAIDATIGAGGHASAMLAHMQPGGRLLGLEADPRTVPLVSQRLREFGAAVTVVNANFREIKNVAQAHGLSAVDAILFDLGLSSMTVDDPRRGFSFQAAGPLDMRFDPIRQTTTAADLVNHGSVDDLTTIFRSYGQEPAAARVAAAIVTRRQHERFADTADLAAVITTIVRRRGPRHPATRIFQALRMAVNDELGVIQAALPQALELLRPGGRLAVITFHSLEDRIVKRWMREMATEGQATLLTKHPIKPSRAEQVANPRSRSANLRVLEKN